MSLLYMGIQPETRQMLANQSPLSDFVHQPGDVDQFLKRPDHRDDQPSQYR